MNSKGRGEIRMNENGDALMDELVIRVDHQEVGACACRLASGRERRLLVGQREGFLNSRNLSRI
jgi:hypothetical protein